MKDLIKAITLASTMLLLPSEGMRIGRHQGEKGEVPDPGCNSWNYETQSCDQCSWRWVKIDGECVAVSDDCRTWNDEAECTSCYWGWTLEDGECTSWSNMRNQILYYYRNMKVLFNQMISSSLNASTSSFSLWIVAKETLQTNLWLLFIMMISGFI